MTTLRHSHHRKSSEFGQDNENNQFKNGGFKDYFDGQVGEKSPREQEDRCEDGDGR